MEWTSARPLKIIIDADPGIDDSMALLYAAARPEFDIQAVTTVFGNTGVATCTRNALALLELAERSDVPVAAGAATPLLLSPETYQAQLSPFLKKGTIHGHDGLGGAELPEPTARTSRLHAADLILNCVRQYPGEIVIAAIGRLTNVALAIIKDRTTMEQLRGISFMGGAVQVPGNAAPTAEANIFGDPEAAELVLGLAVPKVMVPLDVTMKALLLPADLQRIAAQQTRRGRFLRDALRFYQQAYHGRQPKLPGTPCHDVSAVSCLLHPELFTIVPAPLRVETWGKYTRGQTVADLRAYSPEPINAHICLDVNARAVIADFLTTVETGGQNL